ncbi:MAG: hypothetical protein HYV51_01275 [Parcubacteria group bacterium]|nr:hypothetical protein [Parcubacteria group bacterium]
MAVLSVNVSNATGTTAALNINSATSSLLFVRSDGNVGIGTTSPGSLLSVHSSGNVYIGGNLTVSGTTNLSGSSFSSTNASPTLQPLTRHYLLSGVPLAPLLI